jgi:N-acetyl sugar amidotransferase
MIDTSRGAPLSSRRCVRCVMDMSDPAIRFDSAGLCNHCTDAIGFLKTVGGREGKGDRELAALSEDARKSGRGKPYDVLIGLSGGVDSTYVAYLTVRKLGLRPLAIHFDNGWNSELAVHNIERTVQVLGIDLHSHVVDWNEFKDLQLSFFKSNTSNLEAPTDHAIRALLFRLASKHGIRHVLSGGNAATEFILPAAWLHPHSDLKFLLGLHRRFGTLPLRTFPTLGMVRAAYYTLVKKIRFYRILNSIDYRKEEAIATIRSELGWRPYDVKHGESTFTRFFQCYILPHKFGFDKRIAHLSSLIASGQTTREAALAELAKQLFTPAQLEADIAYVTKKLGMTRQEFLAYMSAPAVEAATYPNQLELLVRLRPLWQRIAR